MVLQTEEMVAFVAAGLARLADPESARGMAAYMKTDMPCYGVKKPQRMPVFEAMVEAFPVTSAAEYEAAVRALWRQPHREEKYFAISLARHHERFIELPRLDLYRRLIVEGAWWDFVDEIAAHLVGHLFARHPGEVGQVLDRWIDDEDLWLRRTAILAQLRHGADTDATRLFDYCLRRAHEREFFIRKAIGWALREYAKSDPDAVRRFVGAHEDQLSGLSRREALKHIG